MKSKQIFKQKGFTLIELVVVIAIIGLLASIMLVSMNRARIKARDAKRISDLHQLAVALDLYYSQNGNIYPDDLNWCDSSKGLGLGKFCLNNWRGSTWQPNGLSQLVPGTASLLPNDPVNSGDNFYYYEPVQNETQFNMTCGAQACAYMISTKLEDLSSPYSNPGCNTCYSQHNYCVVGGGAKIAGPC